MAIISSDRLIGSRIAYALNIIKELYIGLHASVILVYFYICLLKKNVLQDLGYFLHILDIK